MSELLKLAERCEKAAGPDRELDALITIALDLRPEWLKSSPGTLWLDAERINGEPVIRFKHESMKRRHPGNPPSAYCPSFTGSIDAVLLLVPEGWHWSVYDTNGVNKACAQVEQPEFSSAPFTGEAATPALSFCAAALRARAV
jgi:hypothetical protein